MVMYPSDHAQVACVSLQELGQSYGLLNLVDWNLSFPLNFMYKYVIIVKGVLSNP
jgi:hypothetical protein